MRNSHEKQRKAIQEKMDKAALAAELYLSSDNERVHKHHKSAAEIREHRNKMIRKKLIRIFTSSILYFIIVILFGIVCFVPFKDGIMNMIGKKFGSVAPEYATNVELIDGYNGSDITDGKVYENEIKLPSVNESFAQISCEDIKLDAAIYYGKSYEALRENIVMMEKSSLPGYGSPVVLYGYNTKDFKKLENIKKDSVITLTTNYGVYKYKVAGSEKVSSGTTNGVSSFNNKKDILVLTTDYPFGILKGVKNTVMYYVYAEKISGPTVIR